jgi:hypothetical protein
VISGDEDDAPATILHGSFIEAGGDDRIERLHDPGARAAATSLAPLPPRSASTSLGVYSMNGFVASMSTLCFGVGTPIRGQTSAPIDNAEATDWLRSDDGPMCAVILPHQRFQTGTSSIPAALRCRRAAVSTSVSAWPIFEVPAEASLRVQAGFS